MKRQLARSRSIVLFALLTLAALALWLGNATTELHAQGEEEQSPARASAGASLESEYVMGDPYLIADIAEKATPAIVYIEAEYPAPERNHESPFNDPFFRDFFYPFFPWTDTEPQVLRGTGFIIDQEGHILTNQHVVGDPGDGQSITVKIDAPGFTGEVEAELVGADYQLDLAILRIDKPEGLGELPTVALGDSDQSRVGEWVIAIGNPYGEQFEHTVTVGVLSAKGREVRIYDSERRQTKVYSNLMQTDAAINPGNSGGPLINIKGEVIGINTAVNARAQGIGFAIPINTALNVKDELIETGGVAHVGDGGPYLGVELQNLDDNLARYLGLSEAKGALVTGVVRGSAAERAGIRVYDVVQQFGDVEIESADDLVSAIGELEPGDDALVVIWRQGRRIVLPVVLGSRGE